MTPLIVRNRHRRAMRTATAPVVAGLACLVVVLTGCSSDGSSTAASSTTATSTTPAVCASAEKLRTSLSSLADVQVVQEGTDALRTQWTQVQDDWSQFADDARSQHSGQVDDVQADASAAGDAVDTALSDASAQTLAAAGTAITTFVRNAGALVDEVRSTC